MLVESHPSAPLEDLTADLRLEFPDIPERTLAHFLRRAAVRMCRDGDLDRRSLSVETFPGVEAYRLELPPDVEIQSVMSARDRLGPVDRLTRAPEGPVHGPCVWLTPPDELGYRSPSRRRGLVEVEVSVAPSRDADAIAAILGERHYETLLAGARSLIYAVGGKPWSSPDVAEVHRRAFVDGIAAAKVAELTGRQKGFWRVRNERVL
jgi:hypothetical protein